MTEKDYTHKRGDTFQGFTCLAKNQAGTSLDIAGASALLQIRANRSATPIVTLTTVSGITIDDGLGGTTGFKVAPVIIDAPSGLYFWDAQLTLVGGRVVTGAGGRFTIEDDVSHG